MRVAFLFLIVLSLVIPFYEFVQGQENGIVVCTQIPCTWEDFSATIINLIKTVVIVSFWIAFLMVSIGAFLMMLGGTSESRYQQGKGLILTAIIGYILILVSGIIFDIILDFFNPQFKTFILPQIAFAQNLVCCEHPAIDYYYEWFCDSCYSAGWSEVDPSFCSQPPPSASSCFSNQPGTSNQQTNNASQFIFGQTLEPTTWYAPLRDVLMSSLKCGQNAEPIFNSFALGRLFACIFEVISLLKNIAVVLLVFAIIASAFYLIATPLFGLGNIAKAYKILVWSIIGLVIILLADLIRAQIERLLR